MKKANPFRGGEGGEKREMDYQRALESQQALADFARERAEKISPEINKHQQPDNGTYIYFPVIEQYFEREPIIDVALIEKLKEGGRLLSVGVGPAKLEHLLYREFNLPKDAITLVDIEFSPEAVASDLDRIAFDMREEWPHFDKKFDYILFPESFGVARFRVDDGKSYSNRVQRFSEDVREVSDFVFSGNTLEVSDRRWDFAKLIIEMDLPWVKKKYSAISCGVNALKKNGELRFSGHLMSRDELTYVVMRLKEDFGSRVEVKIEPYLKIKVLDEQEITQG